MSPLIEDNLEEILRLSGVHGVRKLEVLRDLVEPRAIRNRRLRRHIERSKFPVYAPRPLATGARVLDAAASDYL